MTPSVVLAEDNALLRDALSGSLGRFDLRVVAAVADADALIAAVAEHDPDLVVTDVRMPPGFGDEGLRAALRLRSERPGRPTVVLSQYVEQNAARELLADGHGAIGYLLKDRVADLRSLVDALGEVLAGGTVVDPEVVRLLLARHPDPVGRLSAREQETLGLMAQGRSNAAIARELVVTEATVAKHIRSVLERLDLPPAVEDHRRVRAVLAYLQRPTR